jgi:ABC-type multidrug transport system fused ATPase/permease subunit
MGNLFEKIIKSNIFKNGLLRNILIVSIMLVTTLPLYDYLVIRPSFDKFLTESTNDEALKIAKHFVATFLPKKTELSINTIRYYLSGNIENFKSNFRLTKFKIFSNSGEILFSTDPKEIGDLNNQRYFHEIVAKGKVITKGIQKETKSLEGQVMLVDVVETYVPLMSDGIFLGAFEIYYDITTRKQQLDKLLSRSSALVFIIVLGLLLSIIVILFIENKTISKRKQAEKEREKLIAELQDAVTKIKTLRGLLPICSSCKKIRDDKGYWKQIESYIRDHSEAEFTHSMCPICAKKFYPELFQE